MTDLKALVQSFLDADDELREAQKSNHVAQPWAAFWKARQAADAAKVKRDEAFEAMRAAVREGK